MKSILWRFMLSAALLGATMALAAEPRVGKFVRYDTGEYVIVTSRGEPQAQRVTEDLAKTRATLERLIDKRAMSNPLPTMILITNESDWDGWVMPRPDIYGYFHSELFHRAPFANYMATNGAYTPDAVRETMIHEFTHYFLASQFAGEYPPWFDEGLAEVLGNARFHEGKVILEIPWRRLEWAGQREWIPFSQMLGVDQDDPEYRAHRMPRNFYTQAWLIVHAALIDDPEFGRQMTRYLNLLKTRTPPEQAAREAFGDDLSAVDRRLEAYLFGKSFHAGIIKIGEVPAVALGKGQPLGQFDAMATIVNLVLGSELPPQQISPLVDSMERHDPNVARAAVFAAELAQRTDDNLAFDRAVARAEVALAPDDWERRRDLASLLLANSGDPGTMQTRTKEQIETDLKRAMRWFGEAIAQNKQDIEALWGYGTAATRLGYDLDRAENALLAAYRRAPNSAEIAQSLANLKARQQKPEEMLPYLNDVIRNTRDPKLRSWASQTYLQTQQAVTTRQWK